MKRIIRHIKRVIVLFLVNRVFEGTNPRYFSIKVKLLRSIGWQIGSNTSIVGPIICTGQLEIGDNCWVGTNFVVRGNGRVKLGNNIDVAPDVTCLTGTHEIGDSTRRAGRGYNCDITIGDGCWIGGNSTIVNNVSIGLTTVVAACACVCKDVPHNALVGGVPARIIKVLGDERTDL